MSERNKALVREIFEEVWNQRQPGKIADFYSESVRDEIAAHFRELLDGFSDLHVSLQDPGLIAEGDYVAMRLTVSGTHDSGPFAGQVPSGKRITWASLRIFKIVDGMVVATWAMQDRLSLMEQLGAIQPVESGVHWFATQDGE